MRKMKNLYFLAFTDSNHCNSNYFHPIYFNLILYSCLGFFEETYNNFIFRIYANLCPINFEEVDLSHHMSC